MKSFFKRSAISVVVLGMAGSIYAAVPSNTISWPQLSGVFLGVEGLDLRPQNGDLDYVTVFPSGYPTTTAGNFSTNAISPSYDWSWRVYGGIKFTDNDDLTLSWMRLNTSDNAAVSPPGAFPNNAGLSSPRWLAEAAPWASVNGRVTFELDDAYAVWGHTINFNNPWSVRFAGGLEYAKLNNNLSVTADPGVLVDIGPIGFESKDQTKGIGPRVEIDMTYHLPYGFALFGNANGALLVSTRDLSLYPTNTDETDIIFNASNFSDRHVVIPKFGMRLGASYAYVWGQAGAEGVPCRTTTLTIDAGWQAETFIHAIERPDTGFVSSPTVSLTQSLTGSFTTTKTSNFSDQGLFVGVKLSSDWL